jgi:hypothetical protein
MSLTTCPEGAIRHGAFRLDIGEACIRWCGPPARVTADLVPGAPRPAASRAFRPTTRPWRFASGDRAPNRWFSTPSGTSAASVPPTALLMGAETMRLNVARSGVRGGIPTASTSLQTVNTRAHFSRRQLVLVSPCLENQRSGEAGSRFTALPVNRQAVFQPVKPAVVREAGVLIMRRRVHR